VTDRARLAAALRASPERADLALTLAKAHARAGEWNAGVQLLRQAALLHPAHREVAFHRVSIPFAADRWAEAAQEATAVLQTIPNHVRVWRLAARTFTRLGMTDTAIHAWQSALGFAPNHLWSWFELGNLLLGTGQFGQAVGAYRNALKCGEPHAAVLGNLGAALLHGGRPGAARRRLEAAVALDAQWAPAWVSLAQCHSALGDEEEADAAFLTAVRTAPDRVATRLAYGEFLVAGGRTPDAEAQFRAVLAGDPNHRGALLGLGTVLERTGAHAEAVAVLDPLVDASSKGVGPLAAWARACIRTQQAHRAIPVLAQRAQRLLTPSQAQVLHHTLGNLHAAVGDHEAAFNAHQVGNRARENDINPAGVVREVAEVCRLLSTPVERPPGRGVGMLFIVGMPRSGTSLVEQILSRHPAVVAGGELPSLNRVLRGPDDPPVGSAWADRLVHLDASALDALGDRYRADAARLAHLAPDALGPDLWLTDKQPTNFLMLGAIPRILPGARIVHCTRDPLDTCLSCFFQHFGPGHTWTTELDWLGAIYRAYRAQMHHWTTVAEIDVVEVQYEHLVADLEGGVRRLLAALDLPFHPDCLSFYESDRDARTASVDQVRRPIYRSSVRRADPYRPWLGPLVDALADLQALPPAVELVPR